MPLVGCKKKKKEASSYCKDRRYLRPNQGKQYEIFITFQAGAGNKQDPALYDLREEKDLDFKVVALRCWLRYSWYKP